MIRKAWSIVERIGRFLGREYYVGGETFHRKYAFGAAVMIVLAALIVVALSSAGEEGLSRDTLVGCLMWTGMVAGVLAIRLSQFRFAREEKWTCSLLLSVALLGLVSLLTWWVLRIFGWSPGYEVSGNISDNKIKVGLAVITIFNMWVAIGLFKSFRRASALLAVAQSSSEDHVSYLSDADPDIVTMALSVLKDRQDPAGRDKARELLKNHNEYEYMYAWLNAALYLGAIGDEQAAPYLIKLLTHPDESAHKEAAEYLRTFTGQDFGADYEAWAEWWQEQGHPEAVALEPVRPEPRKSHSG